MRTILAMALAAAACCPAQASNRSEAMDLIASYIAATNGDSREAYAAFCREDTVILDGAPPFAFRGRQACAAHWDAVLAWYAKNKIVATSYAKVGAPSFEQIVEDRAYVVLPWSGEMTVDGRKAVEKGTVTFVLKRSGDRAWAFEAIAWAVAERANP